MKLIAYFLYLLMGFLGIESPPSKDEGSTYTINSSSPAKGGSNQAEEKLQFELEIQSPDQARLVIASSLASKIYQHLDESLLADISEYEQQYQISTKSSEEISCTELLNIASAAASHWCVMILSPDGFSFAGWQGEVGYGSGVEPSEIRLTLVGTTAEDLWNYLNLPVPHDPSGQRVESIKSGFNFQCAFRQSDTINPYQCRIAIRNRGLVLPFGSGDPIVRVGAVAQLQEAQQEPFEVFTPEMIRDERFGLGSQIPADGSWTPFSDSWFEQ